MHSLTLLTPERKQTLTTAAYREPEHEPEWLPVALLEQQPAGSPALLALIQAAEIRRMPTGAVVSPVPQLSRSVATEETTTQRTRARYAFD